MLSIVQFQFIYDRSGRGIKKALGVKVTTPTKTNPSDSAAKKKRMRRRFRHRAGIEPLIGHLKTDHRLGQNYLYGEESPQINAWLAAAEWNLKKWMEQWVRDGKKMDTFCLVVHYRYMLSPTHFEFLRSD